MAKRPLRSDDPTYPSWPHPGRGVKVPYWGADWFCDGYDQYGPSTGIEGVGVDKPTEGFTRRLCWIGVVIEKEIETTKYEESKKKKQKSRSSFPSRRSKLSNKKESKRRKLLECKECAKAARAEKTEVVNKCKLTSAYLAID